MSGAFARAEVRLDLRRLRRSGIQFTVELAMACALAYPLCTPVVHTDTPRSEHRSAQRIESMPAWLSDCFEAMRRVSKRCIVEWI
ncbi:hypothetical protein J2804_003647 [Paraburkholderia terricola]|uniref:Uncharacterized protein n=1 Tax=Paraburkholderia terricola TaxID=169427 RepID=A0ABU1LUN7_9BURK|nr:hypothetical protein [Paraburkholderia terricola]